MGIHGRTNRRASGVGRRIASSAVSIGLGAGQMGRATFRTNTKAQTKLIAYFMDNTAMNMTTEAIYEHGTLRLLSPLELPEQTHVRVSVTWGDTNLPSDEHIQVEALLVASGLVKPKSAAELDSVVHVSVARRAELARIFGQGQSLSDFIISERDGR